MTNRPDQQLERLPVELIQMGALSEDALSAAAEALLKADATLADAAEEAERELDRQERAVEDLCLKLLLQQQPVARDLRQISAALKMVTDMERIGDQAADIAEIAVHLEEYASECGHIREMAENTIHMVTESVDAYVKRDVTLAQSVIAYDDVVDECFDREKRRLMELIARDPEEGGCALDLLMVAKYFERIGDHAANIAEWVIFSVTGVHKSGD